MIRRRTLVLAGLAAAVVGAVSFWPLRPWRRRQLAPAEIEADLRGYFAFLRFDDEVIAAFLRDLARLPEPLRHGDLRRRFLLSTDFFVNGEDESRPLRYRAFYDPYLSPCYRPFA